jgi:hypothetical protein
MPPRVGEVPERVKGWEAAPLCDGVVGEREPLAES